MIRENLQNYVELRSEHVKVDSLLKDGAWQVVRYKGYLSIMPQSVGICAMERVNIEVKDGRTDNEIFLGWLREKLGLNYGKLLFAEIPTENWDDGEEYPNYISTTMM